MTMFVLVPGACHGGWWYQPVVDALGAAGHEALAMSLAGLDESGPDWSGPPINLDTHIDQTIAAVTAAIGDGNGNETDLILVGHSYGGSVISGVADRLPGRVGALVYLDAFVPDDGDSCYSMTDDEQRRWYTEGAAVTGYGVEPLPFFDPRARPHPVATLLQRSRLSGAWRSVPVKHYVAATGWPGRSPFADTTERVESEPGWIVHEWETRHNVLHDGPQRVVELLLSL
jgi:pimeloyl-ACP methyl ester carboxylesterase